jgi:glyoxylase-like metal-dependent hydrolase (beta-lactamase superfamily II)/rhodanese-related sulfurtransferase
MFRSTLSTKIIGGLILVLAPVATAVGAGIEDAESATHDAAASTYQIVGTYEFPGMKIVQFDLAVLAHYSYLVVSGTEAVVVDPGRDVTTYLEAAEHRGATIKSVWLSHSHADFVAGHIEFAKQLNVPIQISAQANAGYPHRALKEGDTLEFGDAVLKFIETPGHTLDSMCAVVSSKQQPARPLALLSGDTLFIGSVGRPDLLGDDMAASTLAGMMYDTWAEKLSQLPDDVLVLPAHGAGSLCGADLADVPVSTIGEQKQANPYAKYTNRTEFIAAVLAELPEAPQYFAHNAALNRAGPPPAEWEFEVLPLASPSAELADPAKYYLVDIREAGAYADSHIPGSVNISLRGRFESWVGRMVPWAMNGERLVLVSDDPDSFREALVRLHRVGYQARVLSLADWQAAGLPLRSTETIAPRQLAAEMRSPRGPLVVDVRLPQEWSDLRIGTIINIPLDILPEQSNKLDRREKIVTVCNSAYRSSMAVGLLERRGFGLLANLQGGTEAWLEAGLPYHEAALTCPVPGGSTGRVRVPDRIAAAELKRMMLDLPGTFELVDIRPADHFADYRLPGSVNLTIDQLLADPDVAARDLPLVIVDRDGSLGMMVAGMLAQYSTRPIKVLYGGLQAYWNEAGLGGLLSTSPLGGVPAARSQMPAPRSAPDRSRPAPTTKRRSAGC